MAFRIFVSVIAGIAVLMAIGLLVAMGPGVIERKFTLGGIYAVCKPDGYDVVCFGDKAGKDGGVHCVPLKEAGGQCR